MIVGDLVREKSNRFWTREPRTGVVVRISRDAPALFRWDDGTVGIVTNQLGVEVITPKPAAGAPPRAEDRYVHPRRSGFRGFLDMLGLA